jgi:hypothetical protein
MTALTAAYVQNEIGISASALQRQALTCSTSPTGASTRTWPRPCTKHRDLPEREPLAVRNVTAQLRPTD